MTDKSEWQGRVGSSWASEWERTDRSFAGITDRLLGAASAGKVEHGLDIGCGAGELTLAMARGHHAAEFVGLDISTQLIDVAKDRGKHLPNLSFELADASVWTREGFAPDLLFSRHGVMFFEDPAGAFRHLHNIAAFGARLVFSCFRSARDNVWASDIIQLLPAGAAPSLYSTEPGPFAFADAAHVQGILTKAGWGNAALEPVDYPYVAGTGENAVEDALSYFLSIGPAARAAAGLEDIQRALFIKQLRSYLASNEQDGIVALHAAAWIVTASK